MYLEKVRVYMESNGWVNVFNPLAGPDNALLHCVANMIAVGSGRFATPEAALEAFQAREIGDESHTMMDRHNNLQGELKVSGTVFLEEEFNTPALAAKEVFPPPVTYAFKTPPEPGCLHYSNRLCWNK